MCKEWKQSSLNEQTNVGRHLSKIRCLRSNGRNVTESYALILLAKNVRTLIENDSPSRRQCSLMVAITNDYHWEHVGCLSVCLRFDLISHFLDQVNFSNVCHSFQIDLCCSKTRVYQVWSCVCVRVSETGNKKISNPTIQHDGERGVQCHEF